jgi:hypothetical protein
LEASASRRIFSAMELEEVIQRTNTDGVRAQVRALGDSDIQVPGRQEGTSKGH